MTFKSRILFVCYDQSAKSPMAAALARHLSGGAVFGESAGAYSIVPIAKEAQQVLAERGIEYVGRLQFADDAKPHHADLIVCMTTTYDQIYGRPTRHWRLRAYAEEGNIASYRRLRDELETRVRDLLKELDANLLSSCHDNQTATRAPDA